MRTCSKICNFLKSLKNAFKNTFFCCCCVYKTINDCDKRIRRC